MKNSCSQATKRDDDDEPLPKQIKFTVINLDKNIDPCAFGQTEVLILPKNARGPSP